jgi:hypothetical protein
MNQRLIFVRRSLLQLVLAPSLLISAVSASGQTPVKPRAYADVELKISGPPSMPLFRKGHGEKFTAVLVNRSAQAILFVLPHRDWDEEIFTTWDAKDSKGRYVSRIQRMQIYCIITTMYARPIFAPTPIDPQHPKAIDDKDLVILQPGEQFEFADIADPSFSLRFPRRGTFQVMLSYQFYPEHYVMAQGSRKTGLLKKALPISTTSNALTLTLN